MYQQQYQQPPAQQQRQQQQHAGGQSREPIDPFQARQLYRNELASLTFNSKPIITSLTISAGENTSVSKVIVQTIEERLRTAPANQKLPTLYLIDSIIKNVGGPYLNLFARTIVTLFLDAYAVVDPPAKASFEKVLGTWPNWTSQLFPKELIAKIEQGVRSMRQQKQGSYQPSSTHGKPHYSDRSREDPYSQNASNMTLLFPVAFLLGITFIFICYCMQYLEGIFGLNTGVIDHSRSVLTSFGVSFGNGQGHGHGHGHGYGQDKLDGT